MKVYRITEYGSNPTPLILENLTDLSGYLGGIEYEELGNKYLVEIIEMGKDEFQNLCEWGGF